MKYIYTNKKEKIIVDDKDYRKLSSLTWYINQRGYPQHDKRSGGKEIRFLMHRFLIKPPKDKEVDHINENKLDNRRQNLRICTHEENTRNRKKNRVTKSGFKGVSYHPDNCNSRPWQVSIGVKEYGYMYIGAFKTVKEAAEAYNEAAIKYHGNFASLNKI